MYVAGYLTPITSSVLEKEKKEPFQHPLFNYYSRV